MDTHLDHHDRSQTSIGQSLISQSHVPAHLLTEEQRVAADYLERSVRDLEPITALTGAPGTGKTVALNFALARRDRAGDRIIRLRNFVGEPLTLHRALAATLGVTDARRLSAVELEPKLRRALTDAGQAEPPVLVVDDAHMLQPGMLRYLALLADLREAGRPLFRIVLAGRPAFAAQQPVPLLFTMEPLQPDAAREVAEHGLAAAGLAVSDETMEDIVLHSQGNLHMLYAMLHATVEEAQPGSKKRAGMLPGRLASRARQMLGGTRRRQFGPSIVVGTLLAGSAVCAFIAFSGGLPHNQDSRVAALTTTPAEHSDPTPPPSPAPPAMPASTPVSATPVSATPALATSPSATTPALAAAAASNAGPPPPAAPQPAAPAADVPVPQQATAFRVYNISTCRHGVCPRWSVTDLDHHVHFVTAFNPASLHLDPGTLQQVRAGNLDLLVSGSVTPDAHTLDAEALQSVVPHHGRVRAPAVAPIEPVDAEALPPRSPPPGFLPIPSTSPPPDPYAVPQQ